MRSPNHNNPDQSLKKKCVNGQSIDFLLQRPTSRSTTLSSKSIDCILKKKIVQKIPFTPKIIIISKDHNFKFPNSTKKK